MPFAARWMDLEIIILCEERKRQNHDITCMWNLKYDTNELICKTETDSEYMLMVIKEERGWGRDKLGVWD